VRNVCGGTTNNYKSKPKKFGGKYYHKNLLEIFLYENKINNVVN
jgi:hypothetical protein